MYCVFRTEWQFIAPSTDQITTPNPESITPYQFDRCTYRCGFQLVRHPATTTIRGRLPKMALNGFYSPFANNIHPLHPLCNCPFPICIMLPSGFYFFRAAVNLTRFQCETDSLFYNATPRSLCAHDGIDRWNVRCRLLRQIL